MQKLNGILLIAIVCLLSLGIVLGARGGWLASDGQATGKAAQSRTATTGTPEPSVTADPKATPLREMPDEVKFQFLFQHLAKINEKPGSLRNYQGKTGLADAAYSMLVQLAIEHQQEAAVIDQQSKVIIDNFHAQYPRKLPPGMLPPPPPQELLDLEARRDALALRYRDRIKAQLGNESYTRFKQAIDEEFRPKPQGGAAVIPIDPRVLPRREDR